jgi:hypothetical protein
VVIYVQVCVTRGHVARTLNGSFGFARILPFSFSEFLGVRVFGGILTSCAVELVCMRALMDLVQFPKKNSGRTEAGEWVRGAAPRDGE